MKKVFLLAAAVIAFSIINYTHAQLRKVPAEVTEAFKAKYPDTKNVEWKDKVTSFQASYETDNVKYESKFNSKGEWLQTAKEVEQDALPQEVKDGYSKSKFTEWELTSATWIQSKDKGVQYRLFVKKNDIEKKYLYFDETGKLVKDLITI